MKLMWMGPYERPYSYFKAGESTQQEYRLVIGSLVYLGSLHGRGGQYDGNLDLPGNFSCRVRNLPLKEAMAKYEATVYLWIANMQLSFDDDILKIEG